MPIELVVGLGNPGSRYARNRHNIGFRTVDVLAGRLADGEWLRRPLYDVVSSPIEPRLILAKPRTFMNRSGEAVASLAGLLELEPRQLLVVVDDIDLPLGSIRLRRRGGPGTHNGLRDICRRIGEEFPRLRVGVRGRGPIDDLASYVLADFEGHEAHGIAALLQRAADAAETAVRVGLERAMSRFNSAPQTTPGE
jgi:PTH1 family peptidyl-tRNA hydrolase